MLGITKKQKIDQKQLLVAYDAALTATEAVSADQLLSETGKTRQELLDAVMADDEVISCREDIEGAISAAAWRIWGDDVNEDTINRLYRIIRRLHNDFALLAVLAKFNGYSVAEYVFKKEPDGFLSLHSLLSKDGELDNYTPMRDGSVQLATEDDSIEINQVIKYLVLTSKAVPARPAGELMIVRAYPAVALRRREWAYAGQFIARYAQPYVVGRQGDSIGSVQDFTSKIFAFINGGAMGIGGTDSIDLHQLSGDGSAFELFERLANRRIQKLLLGRVKISEMSSSSNAAQATEDMAREARVSGYTSLMTKAVQHAIDAVLTVNQYWGRPITAPQGIWFEYERETTPDINRATVDKMYADTGQIAFTRDYFMDILGYEEAHFTMIDVSSAASKMQLSQPSPPQRYLLANDGLPSVLTADSATTLERETANERAIMQPKVQALLSLCADCESYDEFSARLQLLELPDGGMIESLAAASIDSYQQGLDAE